MEKGKEKLGKKKDRKGKERKGQGRLPSETKTESVVDVEKTSLVRAAQINRLATMKARAAQMGMTLAVVCFFGLYGGTDAIRSPFPFDSQRLLEAFDQVSCPIS